MRVMVIDVESVGLHGEGFWAAWVLVDLANPKFQVLEEGSYYSPECLADGSDEGRSWIAENVDPSFMREGVLCANPGVVRSMFWGDWKRLKEQGAVMAGECIWPVESGFLSACVADDLSREWEGPYPLYDISTLIKCAGADPMAEYERLGNEKAHSALGDARQSARLLHRFASKLKEVFRDQVSA